MDVTHKRELSLQCKAGEHTYCPQRWWRAIPLLADKETGKPLQFSPQERQRIWCTCSCHNAEKKEK